MTKPEYAFLKKDGHTYESENENEREIKGEGGGGGGEAATGMNNRNMYKSFLKKITSDGRVSPEQDCSYPTRLNMSDTSGGFRPMAAVVAWHPPVRADFRAVLRVGGRAAIFVHP